MPAWLEEALVIFGIWSAIHLIADMAPKHGEKVLRFGSREERERRAAQRRRDMLLAIALLFAAMLSISIWGR